MVKSAQNTDMLICVGLELPENLRVWKIKMFSFKLPTWLIHLGITNLETLITSVIFAIYQRLLGNLNPTQKGYKNQVNAWTINKICPCHSISSPVTAHHRTTVENKSLEDQRYKTNWKRSKLIYKVTKHKQAKGYTNVSTATNTNKSKTF